MTKHTRLIPPDVVEARGRLHAIAELSHLPSHLWPQPPQRDGRQPSPEIVARGIAHLRLCAMAYIEELSRLVHTGLLAMEGGQSISPAFTGITEYRTRGVWDAREPLGAGMARLEYMHEQFDQLEIVLHGGIVHGITHAGLELRLNYTTSEEWYE